MSDPAFFDSFMQPLPTPVVSGRAFCFAAIGLDHGHIVDMCRGLLSAGAHLKWVYDLDPKKVSAFLKTFPGVIPARNEDQILDDPEIRMVASAAVPVDRCPLGVRVMEAGKDFFSDKAPMISLEQLETAREAVHRTGRKYMVFYGERLNSESGVFAGRLIEAGAIGRVLQVIGLGPHRLNVKSRAPWFFERAKYGGILCDIGSHQAEQYLYYTGETQARVVRSQIANYAHPEFPELDDFGEAMLVGERGATGYFRVDWFTPDGLSNWGDGRTFILGDKGYIEMRKYVDVGVHQGGDRLILVDGQAERSINLSGKVGFPFFGQLILDCLNRTENAMSQRHAFLAAELSLRAAKQAVRIQ